MLIAAQTILGIGIGAALLHVFYRAVEFRWPESYVGAGDTGAYSILASPVHYIGFRALPVYVVCVLVATTSSRAGLSPFITSLGVATFQGLSTSGRVLLHDIRRRTPALWHRLPLVLLRSASLVVALLAGTIAGYSYTALAPFIPPLDQVALGLWTAVLAAVLGAYLAKMTSGGGASTDQLLARSYRTLDRSLWELAQTRAEFHGADPQLLRAIMLVENIQRPPWVRRLEYLKARSKPPGTYGVMQVAAPEPIYQTSSRSIEPRRD